ncbi:MAG: hypothetical protein ACSHX6_06770 [Akkermansiaceae bacterium]
MSHQDPYQSPDSKVKTDFSDNDDIKLWLPQAIMLAEKGKSEASIRHFFKSKGIAETHISEAAKHAFDQGRKNNTKGKLPYTIVGWAFIIPSLIWLLYTLFTYQSFMFILLLPIAVGYGLIKGVYLPDRD